MIKATTQHGTYYVIDMEQGIAKRVKGEGRNSMHGDGEWFSFLSVSAYDRDKNPKDQTSHLPIEVGKAMFFVLRGPRDYDWRLSSTVVSLEGI